VGGGSQAKKQYRVSGIKYIVKKGKEKKCKIKRKVAGCKNSLPVYQSPGLPVRKDAGEDELLELF
jgi:hypothetical protein